MPTILLLDVSLSMARSGDGCPDSGSPPATKKALAVHAIHKYLACLTKHSKLEYVSLMVYSSLWEVVVPFTRDYDLVRAALDSIQLYDKTSLAAALQAAIGELQGVWGSSLACQIAIFTDGMLNNGVDSEEKLSSLTISLPVDFHMFCLSSAEDSCCKGHAQTLTALMETVGGTAASPEGAATFAAVDEMVERRVAQAYTLYRGDLYCGNMHSQVQLYPPPSSAVLKDDFSHEVMEFPTDLSIVGFLSQSDVKSPPCVSRHLVLPLPSHADGETDVDHKVEDGKTPSFVVLLHGALKVESNVALTRIRDNWFGMLHSWADSKKKSNLVLSVLRPGVLSVPWLGDLSRLGLRPPPQQRLSGVIVEQASGLPVATAGRKSYSSQSPCWLRQATLQSDVQKLLRYGRKLPDKINIFYKELNRIHKAAVSIGFHQLLTGLSRILERECTLLPPSAHPDASIQLQHAASLLVKKEVLNMNYIIHPLSTNFNPGDL